MADSQTCQEHCPYQCYATSAHSNRSSAYDDTKHQEARAWDLISSLTINQILESLPPRSVRHIPSSLKAIFQECVKVAFREIETNPTNDSGCKLLFLIPRMILRPQKRGGKSGIKKIKAVYRRFLDFHWEELIQLSRPELLSHRESTEVDQKMKEALRLVKSGGLSRAAKLLTSPGSAPSTDETIQKLKSKHPSRCSPLQDLWCDDKQQFILTKILCKRSFAESSQRLKL